MLAEVWRHIWTDAFIDRYVRIVIRHVRPLIITSGNRLFQPLQSPRRSTNIRHLELLASALVVRDEELLHLVQDGRVEFVNRATVLMTVRMDGHCDQAVILRALAIFGLCRLHDP